ncbi:MAG: hypothetical protein JNK47_23315 [Mesorhizobium sp.]|nr:hypothetical protein [Mesorhizobium sp.]MBL8580140.1 hypothetical protein [Mesorhizobium sp.]
MSYQQDQTRGFLAMRAADTAARSSVQLAAGPFDVPNERRSAETMTLADALLTGLLVIYPVLATVAVIAIGLFLSAPIA